MRPKHRRILRLRQLRKERDWTQQQMADRVGLHVNAYNGIETGRTNPSLENAKAIAKVFNLPVDQVFDYVEVPA
jgi:putative transcriptional regulator